MRFGYTFVFFTCIDLLFELGNYLCIYKFEIPIEGNSRVALYFSALFWLIILRIKKGASFLFR